MENQFSTEEIQLLRQSTYVEDVSEKEIVYTPLF